MPKSHILYWPIELNDCNLGEILSVSVLCTYFQDLFVIAFILPPQSALQHLKEATDLRENVMTSMTRFKEACGLASIANLKQCIRLLSTRLAGSSEAVALKLEFREGCAYLEAEGNLPDMLKKALSSFESVCMAKTLCYFKTFNYRH